MRLLVEMAVDNRVAICAGVAAQMASYQTDNSIASAGKSVGSMPPQRKPVRTLKSPWLFGN